MPKRIMIYLKESDLRILWQHVTWQDVVNLALNGKWEWGDINAKLDLILSKLWETKVEETKHTNLTQKQIGMGDAEIESILKHTTYKWFWTVDWDGWTYYFKDLCPWVTGELREYIKEWVKSRLESGEIDVDFSMFKF